MKLRSLVSFVFIVVFTNSILFAKTYIYYPTSSSNRVCYAAEMLGKSLSEKKIEVVLKNNLHRAFFYENEIICFEKKDIASVSGALKKLKITLPDSLKKEGFFIARKGKTIIVYGHDGNGVIYGCQEIIDRMKTVNLNAIPEAFIDAPEMVLRGTAIGLQKPYYLPGRSVYEYPYTPENFPWFYDKKQWTKYLDMLVANRMNSLYLWNGHPFASLVRLKDYPFAVEVDDETFKKNEEIYSFLTHEADKRGIFVIQMFYNIIVSKPFAEHYNILTQDKNRPITPLLSDYTKKSITAFIEKYPNVGLLVCLGEAMDTYEDDVRWFTETIIPGVKDGLKALNRTDEPPILLRAHDTDAKQVMDAALPIYKNLYTMHKYNGESLTTYEPRGPWAKIHTDLSSLGSVHISNVHILANLEPWRYGSPWFIQKSVQAMHNVHGANALHLYPQASYWDWPFSADKLADGKRLNQIDRDWIWYKAWARYAWNCHRERNTEISFWNNTFNDYYGVNDTDARKIQSAYDETGEIAPKLLRRFGITEGNRQTLLLGMFMSQLVNPHKYKIYPGFYESCGPEGEKLIEYVEKEWKHQPHIGELPLDIIAQVIHHGDVAAQAIDEVNTVTKNNDEFKRLKNDVHCYREFAWFFNYKVKAAKLVLDYQWSNDVSYLNQALPFLEKSLEHYARLVELTKDTYWYANSMQTAQRRIPVGGDNGKNKTWKELYALYQNELINFKNNIQLLKLKKNDSVVIKKTFPVLSETKVKLSGEVSEIQLRKGNSLYADINSDIRELSPELTGLKGFVLDSARQITEGTTVEFESTKPVQLLVGYFRDDQRRYAKAPTLETDAAANLYGQAEPVIMNAIRIDGLPAVNIHSYSFDTGHHKLLLPKGLCLVLGFTSDNIEPHNAGLAGSGIDNSCDWLFY
jgi:hypothetical protein